MKRWSLLLGWLLLAANTSWAGNKPGDVTISVGDAYYLFANKRHVDNTWMPNAAIAYNFDQHWAIEGALGVINSDLNPPVVVGVTKTHGFLYTANGIYRFHPYYNLEPYATFGLGALGLKPNGTNPVYQGNINAGLGAQLFASPIIAFRAEARDLYTIAGGKNDVYLNVGMSFLFDTCCKCYR